LIQACLNQGRWPDVEAIECQLETEFRSWEQKIFLEGERLAAAEERLRHLLSPAADHELKTLYYGIVKKLHPDLHPGLTEEQQRLWHRVQEAYEAGDIEELRALAILAGKSATPTLSANSLELLAKEQQALEQQIQRLLKEIEAIEDRPPLTMRAELLDDAWVRGRCEEIQAAITELQQRCAGLSLHIRTLLKDDSDEQHSGQN
jgi:curved DNA-binding protein CbpA